MSSGKVSEPTRSLFSSIRFHINQRTISHYLESKFDRSPRNELFNIATSEVTWKPPGDREYSGVPNISDGTGYWFRTYPDELKEMRTEGWYVDEYLKETGSTTKDGINPEKYAEWHFNKYLAKYDLNHDKDIDAYEALMAGNDVFDTSWIERYRSKLNQLKAFLEADRNDNGELTINDSFGSKSETNAFLRFYDLDGDGNLDGIEQANLKKDTGRYFYHKRFENGQRFEDPLPSVNIDSATAPGFKWYTGGQEEIATLKLEDVIRP